MLPAFLLFFFFAIIQAGPEFEWRSTKRTQPLVEALEREPGLLGEILKGCSFTDMVNLGRVDKSLNSLVESSHSFGLDAEKEEDLVTAVKKNDLSKAKEALGLTPKRLSRPLRIADSDEISREFDLVTYSLFHNTAEIFELLVEKLGILDNGLFRDQFECLPLVQQQLGKFQALEKHSVHFPLDPERSGWIMTMSHAIFFDYLLLKGYIGKLLSKMSRQEMVNLASAMNPRRYERMMKHETGRSHSYRTLMLANSETTTR